MDGIWVAVITAVVGPIVTLVIKTRLDRKRSGSHVCRVLGSREAMYQAARNLVEHAKATVVDTTWGPDAPQPTSPAAKAREQYKEVRFSGVRYREIFTDTPGRRSRVEEAGIRSNGGPYEGRQLTGFATTKPVVDFMVVDSEHVIISHVRSERAEGHRFLYIRSKPIAVVFEEWFEECWGLAKPIPPASKQAAGGVAQSEKA